jgi:hypothetical protein
MNDSFPISLRLDTPFPGPRVCPSGHARYMLAIMIETLLAPVVKSAGSLLFPTVANILDERGR